MQLVVADTSPLRALRHLGLLELLPAKYDQIVIAPAVLAELLAGNATIPPLDVARFPFLHVSPLSRGAGLSPATSPLDKGEAEAITLALDLRADWLLIDEAKGRAVAKRLGLRVLGVLGLLLDFKRDGLIVAVRPLMDRLRTELGFFISDALYASIAGAAGE